MSPDTSLLLWINQGWADPGLDFIFQWVSGRAGFSMPLLLILLFIFWRRLGVDGLRLWLLMIVGVAMGDLLGNLLKETFSLPRPCYDLFELLRSPGGGDLPQCDAATTGMPSNHALNFFAVALFVTYALRSLRLGVALFAVACVVGLSRIYLGKHTPLQVVSGASIGMLFGYIWAWSSLRAFDFCQRILSASRATGQINSSESGGQPAVVQRGVSKFDPLAFLKSGRRSTELSWSMPIVWSPMLLIILLSTLVWLTDLNQPLFHLFNHLGPTQGDALWANLTLLGDTLVAFTLLSLFARHRLDIVGALFLAAVFATLWVHGLKPLVDNPRPLVLLGSEGVHVIGQALKHHSFPSGHTTTAFTLVGVIILRGVHPLLAVSLLGLALLAGISRAVVGAHWPLDILAGMLGGWLSAALGVWLAQRWPLKPGLGLRLLLLLFFAVCALSLLITRDLGYPQAIALQMLIGLAALGYLLSVLAELWPDSERNLKG
ncbi:MAG: phosphatase PAP2 family protein [Pseudomonadota bacterium]